jgi:hypothetical protein
LLRATVPTLGCERFAARIFPQCIPSLNYRISSYAPPKLNGPVIASINAAARYGIVGEAIPVEQTDAYRPSRSWNGQGHDQLHREALRPEACQTCADTAYGSAAALNWIIKEKQIAPHIPAIDKPRETTVH